MRHHGLQKLLQHLLQAAGRGLEETGTGYLTYKNIKMCIFKKHLKTLKGPKRVDLSI